jgi:hypothetical protein
MAAHIASALYVVCDGYDTTSNDTAILLTTDDEQLALTHAAEFRAMVYRYDVTDDDHVVNEQLIYGDDRRLDTAGVG